MARTRWFGAVVVLAAVLVYANSLPNGFAYDDVPVIRDNGRVHNLNNQAEIWLGPYWSTPDARDRGLYRPLTSFAYAVEWAAGDGSPRLFHAVSVALHAFVSLLVFLLLAALGPRAAAVAGALLFAVHPVHTEAVANVVGQAELLSTAAVLAACLLHARRPRDEPVPPRRIVAIALLFLAAILAKENAIVLLALLPVVDAAAGRFGRGREAAGAYLRHTARLFIPLLAITGVYLTLRALVLGSAGGGGAALSLPFLRDSTTRVLTALQTWPEYLRLLLFPLDLSATYEPATLLPAAGLTSRVAFGALLLAATGTLAVLVPWRRWAYPAAWFLVAILPVSNLLLPVGIVLAERTLYLPSFALAAVVAITWAALVPTPVPRYAASTGLAFVLLFMAGRTVIRNPDWRDTDSIFAAMMRDHPESLRPHWYAAEQALQRGDTAAAERFWGQALQRGPEHPGLISDIGVQQLRLGRTDAAIRLMERARVLRPFHYRNDFYLGLAYLRSGDTARYRQAVSRLENHDYREVAGWLADSVDAHSNGDL